MSTVFLAKVFSKVLNLHLSGSDLQAVRESDIRA